MDADDAFNALNRKLAKKNCAIPGLALSSKTKLLNALFVNEKKMLSSGGTTHGDPSAMAVYSIAVLPLIERAPSEGRRRYAGDGFVDGN